MRNKRTMMEDCSPRGFRGWEGKGGRDENDIERDKKRVCVFWLQTTESLFLGNLFRIFRVGLAGVVFVSDDGQSGCVLV